MELAPFFAAFTIIILAELGDKSMIAVIALSSRHSKKLVFAATMLALTLVSAIGVVVGQVLFDYVPESIITIGAGALFLIFGILTIVLPEKEDGIREKEGLIRGAFWSTFALMVMMELGDKTQLSIIALSAEYGEPWLILIGSMRAFAVVTLAGVLLGAEIGRRVPGRYIKLGSAAIFIVFGLIFLAQGLSGLELF
jgi:putative Ca2+/H+ antiporter (TMEM165/GDT1 family)